MEAVIKIFADFNNADSEGRVRLNTVGTLRDLERMKVELKEGLQVLLDDDDEIKIVGIVSYSENEKIWVASVNWIELK